MPHGKIWGGGGSGHLVAVAHELGVEVRPVQRVEREAVFVRLRGRGGGGGYVVARGTVYPQDRTRRIE